MERDIAIGVDLDAVGDDEEGNTRMIRAVKGSRPELVSLLLRHGAKPNVKNSAGQSPLLVACMLGESEVPIPLFCASSLVVSAA